MMDYCESTFQTLRRPTREVLVGRVGIGSHHPIRIQSMTTSNTRDVEATVEQVIRLADAGAEMVRLTVQGIKEAEACEKIKSRLVQLGYTIPLVADIHFFPAAAMAVVDFVEKVRINPGNYVDKRASFKKIDYDDNAYAKELERIEEKFTPLVEKCKKLGRAMRIGTNHGSLSDRIMNRYGDTAHGMLESALEFARICRKNGYHNFLFSMKASNTHVMIHAYRLLVAQMYQLGWDYPLHLGVTEAGEGEDGRIKSAVGIGSLLLDGIGDTIRVSLTEDPWCEIDPCKRLCALAKGYEAVKGEAFFESYRKIDSSEKRAVTFSSSLPFHRDSSVMVKLSHQILTSDRLPELLGYHTKGGVITKGAESVDCVLLDEMPQNEEERQLIRQLQKGGIGIVSPFPLDGALLLSTLNQIKNVREKSELNHRFSSFLSQAREKLVLMITDETEAEWSSLTNHLPTLIIFSPSQDHLHKARHFFDWLHRHGVKVPVFLGFDYRCSQEDLVIQAAAECGALLCDGLGEGLFIQAHESVERLRILSLGILQASRKRSSKTDFISCPGCGRTLFELQEVSRRIKARTAHLPGVKIAIMGCIVNGPGEMADADFGYVGSKPGKIDLYIGKECVEKDIPFSEADERLVELIKSHGRWAEPE